MIGACLCLMLLHYSLFLLKEGDILRDIFLR
jgi:hypothetical protein